MNEQTTKQHLRILNKQTINKVIICMSSRDLKAIEDGIDDDDDVALITKINNFLLECMKWARFRLNFGRILQALNAKLRREMTTTQRERERQFVVCADSCWVIHERRRKFSENTEIETIMKRINNNTLYSNFIVLDVVVLLLKVLLWRNSYHMHY